jgi:DNA-binding response OmpR family regulator
MKKKILIIDDDAAIVQGLKIRLKSADYDILTATDGVTGLRLALVTKPDLLILDIWMPVGGGFSVAHRLREEAPGVPFIIITASRKPGLREMASNLGAVAFLEKPYEKEELLAAVTKGLGNAAGTRRAAPEALSFPLPPVTQAPSGSNLRGTTPLNSHIPGQKKILIIEDDRKIAMALGLRIRAAGQEPIFAYDAITGLNAAIKHQPDLVLLDIGLPAGGGLMVAERIQNLVSPITPIIFLTASLQPGLRKKAMALGAVAFMEKPYNSEDLMIAIQSALNPGVEASP